MKSLFITFIGTLSCLSAQDANAQGRSTVSTTNPTSPPPAALRPLGNHFELSAALAYGGGALSYGLIAWGGIPITRFGPTSDAHLTLEGGAGFLGHLSGNNSFAILPITVGLGGWLPLGSGSTAVFRAGAFGALVSAAGGSSSFGFGGMASATIVFAAAGRTGLSVGVDQYYRSGLMTIIRVGFGF